MKKLTTLILAALLGAVVNAGAQGSGKTYSLVWDPNPPEDKVTEYRLYKRDSLEPEGAETLVWSGPETQTAITVQPGVRTIYTLIAVSEVGIESLPSDPAADRPGKPIIRAIIEVTIP